MFPHLGWSNAIPAADASVALTINGTLLTFQGLGYHDHNWGDLPFPELLQFWYWGHARFGPFTVIWFSGADASGEQHQSVYVAQEGEIVLLECECATVEVTP